MPSSSLVELEVGVEVGVMQLRIRLNFIFLVRWGGEKGKIKLNLKF